MSWLDYNSLREALEMSKGVTLRKLLGDAFKEVLGLQLREIIEERFEGMRNTLCSSNDNLRGDLLRGRQRPTWGVR